MILLFQNLFNPQKQLNKAKIAKIKKDYDEIKQMLHPKLAPTTLEPPKKKELYNRSDEL